METKIKITDEQLVELVEAVVPASDDQVARAFITIVTGLIEAEDRLACEYLGFRLINRAFTKTTAIDRAVDAFIGYPMMLAENVAQQ